MGLFAECVCNNVFKRKKMNKRFIFVKKRCSLKEYLPYAIWSFFNYCKLEF